MDSHKGINNKKHKGTEDKCTICFDLLWGEPDQNGKRKGFAATGEKTGGKW